MMIGAKRQSGVYQVAAAGSIDATSWQADGLLIAVRAISPSGASYFQKRKASVDTYSPVRKGGSPGGDYHIADTTLPHCSDITLTTGAWSVACWFHCVAAPAAGETVEVFGQSTYVHEFDNKGWGIWVYASDSSYPSKIVGVSFTGNTASSYVLNSNTTVEAGKTYFVVMTSNASNDRLVYVDGLRTNNTTGNVNPTTTTATISVGESLTTSYQGLIEGRVYNRVLSPAEIALLYAETREDLHAPTIYRTPFFLGEAGAPVVLPGDMFGMMVE